MLIIPCTLLGLLFYFRIILAVVIPTLMQTFPSCLPPSSILETPHIYISDQIKEKVVKYYSKKTLQCFGKMTRWSLSSTAHMKKTVYSQYVPGGRQTNSVLKQKGVLASALHVSM